MRVYVPLTLPLAERLVTERTLEAAVAYAVTPGLSEWYASGDTEELEWAASILAARESLRLLAEDRAAPPRRMVLAVDTPDENVIRGSDAGDERGRVLLRQPIPWTAVQSALVDGREAFDDIEAARAAFAAAAAGDEDAGFAVEAVEGHDLMWFATQEIQFLVELT